MGKRLGMDDPRTHVFFDVLDTVREIEPRVVILENVSSLLDKGMEDTWHIIREELQRLADKDYIFDWATLDAKDHGLPMSRPRLFMLLYKKQHSDGSFRWPELLPRPSIEPWLDGSPLSVHELKMCRPDAPSYAKNLEEAIQKLQRQGGNHPFTTPRLVVLSMSSVITHLDCCPCFLKHVKPIWVLNRGRMLNPQERMRLMGFNPHDFKEPLPADMLGNSMAINTLERLLCRILPAVGLTGPLPDRWADGRAQIELAATVQRFKH